MPEDLIYKIALSLLPGVGDKTARKLVAYCGGARAVFEEKRSSFKKIPGNAPVFSESDKKFVLERAEEEIKFIERKKIKPLFFLDEAYPLKLKHCVDSPVLLYCLGNIDFSVTKVISIVGTRNATEYGKNFCEKFISELANDDIMIVSGLAYGIDITAHRASVFHKIPTVAALAHGLDRIYPPDHRATAENMTQNGGLVTEFLSGTNPDRENFPKRNRIIAGLADATIVIEAGKKGGALITADIANSYNRDVFAVPGKVGDQFSEGCNLLIKKNMAALIESSKDLMDYMGWQKESPKQVQKKLFVELNPEEEFLINILKERGTMPIDHLCLVSKFNTSKTSALLLNLEFAGLVRALPGKMFQLA